MLKTALEIQRYETTSTKITTNCYCIVNFGLRKPTYVWLALQTLKNLAGLAQHLKVHIFTDVNNVKTVFIIEWEQLHH